MWDRRSGYPQKEIDNIDIVFFDKKIYVPLTMRIHVLD